MSYLTHIHEKVVVFDAAFLLGATHGFLQWYSSCPAQVFYMGDTGASPLLGGIIAVFANSHAEKRFYSLYYVESLLAENLTIISHTGVLLQNYKKKRNMAKGVVFKVSHLHPVIFKKTWIC